MDEKIQQKIQELQLLEQSMQQIMQQKQTVQAELNETENALKEVSKSKGDVYKIVGQIMIKSDQKQTEKELEEKKDMFSLRVKTFEDQEKELGSKLGALQGEVTKGIK